MSKYLTAAVAAARLSGAIQRRFYGKPLKIELKGGNTLNLVTHVDKLCEKTVLSFLRKRFPSHGLWGEESGRGGPKGRFTWVVDPLDGTTNYAHAYPFFCCSIALLEDLRPVAGVVFDCLRNEMFTAERGCGAALNGRKIRVSKVSDLSRALLCTGFAYHVKETLYNLENFKRFILKSQAVRRDGAAALNLCYVAAGRFDGFWERGIQVWDMSAGSLIAQEAGAVVTDVTGAPFDLTRENALITNGLIHKAMLEVLKESPDERNFLEKYGRDPKPSPPVETTLPLFKTTTPRKRK
jgi:myo-inositol-1(or 4)-monophosphatase